MNTGRLSDRELWPEFDRAENTKHGVSDKPVLFVNTSPLCSGWLDPLAGAGNNGNFSQAVDRPSIDSDRGRSRNS